MIKRLRLAVSFLTILPVAPKTTVEEKDWGRSIKYFSTVGLLFGVMNALILLVFKYLEQESIFFVFSDKPWLLALTLVSASLLLSGALHLDGLMDAFDGVAANKPSLEETRMVIKDSRVGAFGALAGFLLLIAKIIFLAELDWQFSFVPILFCLILLPAVSRMLLVLVIAFQCKAEASTQELTGGIFNRIRSAFTSMLGSKEPASIINSSAQIFPKHMRKILDIVVNLLILKLVSALIFAPSLIHTFAPERFNACPLLLYLQEQGYVLPFYTLLKLDYVFVTVLVLGYLIFLALRKRLYEHNGDSLGAGLELSEALGLLLLTCFF
jgi:cobalamin synthase